jgi:hypothetical protein
MGCHESLWVDFELPILYTPVLVLVLVAALTPCSADHHHQKHSSISLIPATVYTRTQTL